MLFALPEYDAAFAMFVGNTIRRLARARDPILSAMPQEQEAEVVGSKIQGRAGVDLELEPVTTSVGLTTSYSAVHATDLGELVTQLDGAADHLAKQLVQHFVKTMDAVTAATGNVVDAGGNFTFDRLLEMLERLEWTVDDDDNLVMPTLVMHPDTVKVLPEETDETRARVNELLARKRAEAIARRRRRRLS